MGCIGMAIFRKHSQPSHMQITLNTSINTRNLHSITVATLSLGSHYLNQVHPILAGVVKNFFLIKEINQAHI